VCRKGAVACIVNAAKLAAKARWCNPRNRLLACLQTTSLRIVEDQRKKSQDAEVEIANLAAKSQSSDVSLTNNFKNHQKIPIFDCLRFPISLIHPPKGQFL
jgi:hypothetical protein